MSVPLMPNVMISPFSLESVGATLAAANESYNLIASDTWPSSNLAIFIPFYLYTPTLVVKLACLNGSAVSGNVDVGIYADGGARIVSAGSTAQAGVNAVQTFDITDTVLPPGMYYLAAVLDNAVGAMWQNAISSALLTKAVGCAQMGSAFPLPATATLATATQTMLPFIAASTRVTV